MTQTLSIQAGFKRSYLMILLSASLGIYTSATSSVSHAAIYKCVGLSGDTTYSSSICADDESSKRISNKASALASLDCRVARKFAADVSGRMLTGANSDELFDSYGGLNATSSFALNLISYVYTFEGKRNVSVDRLTSLSTERCESGSFGPLGRHCDVFPSGFIEELGGCSAARGDKPQASTFSAGAGAGAAANSSANTAVSSLNTEPDALENTTYSLPQLGEANIAEPAPVVDPEKQSPPYRRPVDY